MVQNSKAFNSTKRSSFLLLLQFRVGGRPSAKSNQNWYPKHGIKFREFYFSFSGRLRILIYLHCQIEWLYWKATSIRPSIHQSIHLTTKQDNKVSSVWKQVLTNSRFNRIDWLFYFTSLLDLQKLTQDERWQTYIFLWSVQLHLIGFTFRETINGIERVNAR